MSSNVVVLVTAILLTASKPNVGRMQDKSIIMRDYWHSENTTRTRTVILFPLSNFQDIWLHLSNGLCLLSSQPKFGGWDVFIHFNIKKQVLVNLLSNCSTHWDTLVMDLVMVSSLSFLFHWGSLWKCRVGEQWKLWGRELKRVNGRGMLDYCGKLGTQFPTIMMHHSVLQWSEIRWKLGSVLADQTFGWQYSHESQKYMSLRVVAADVGGWIVRKVWQ